MSLDKNNINPVTDPNRKFRFRILALGLILILVSVIMLDFFTNLRYPSERSLPIELQPAWTQDEDLEATMNFWGDTGILFSWVVLLIGIIFVIYGSFGFKRRIHRKFETGFFESFNKVIQSDKNFLFLVICTILFGVIYSFNLLTYPPTGPLYFLRKVFLEQNAPPGFPEELLPTLSTYGAFAVIQDTAILLIYLWVIYVRVRPGRQFGEDFVNLALDRTLFLTVLMSTSIVHAIGHMPFELYGKGQWGTGYSTLESWIAFDKILHMFAAMAIAMLLYMVVTHQFEKYGAENTSSRL
ncbi:MAG: hypothetical protein ACTSW1_09865, partial [Candidatus Hodarchaeales archaeon]